MRATPATATTGPPRPVTVSRARSVVTTAVHATRELHPGLTGLVRSIVGYDQRVAPGAVHLGPPSTGVQLVISFDLDQRIGPADGSRPATTVTSFVAGLYDELVAIAAPRFHGLQVELTPIGALRILGPVAEVARRTVPLDAILGAPGRALEDRLANERGWTDRFDALEAALLRRAATTPPVRRELPFALGRMVATGGRLPVQDLASELAWSRRHLSGTFNRAFGLSPKRVAQLVRLEQVTARLDGGSDLATVAAETGFADQAHLAHEVRAFTGLTPSQLRDRRLPEGWFEVPDHRARGSHPSKTAGWSGS